MSFKSTNYSFYFKACKFCIFKNFVIKKLIFVLHINFFSIISNGWNIDLINTDNLINAMEDDQSKHLRQEQL